jgi:hypothetical protein
VEEFILAPFVALPGLDQVIELNVEVPIDVLLTEKALNDLDYGIVCITRTNESRLTKINPRRG